MAATQAMNSVVGNGNRTLTRETSDGGEVLIVGDFRINLDQHTVFVRGQQVELSSEEFELLVFLVTHPKRMVTPQTMLSSLWQGERVRQIQFLQALLSLRKKLESAGAGPHYIRTEPMVVYRFDPLG